MASHKGCCGNWRLHSISQRDLVGLPQSLQLRGKQSQVQCIKSEVLPLDPPPPFCMSSSAQPHRSHAQIPSWPSNAPDHATGTLIRGQGRKLAPNASQQCGFRVIKQFVSATGLQVSWLTSLEGRASTSTDAACIAPKGSRSRQQHSKVRVTGLTARTPHTKATLHTTGSS